ncbi:MAG: hypothetical protein LBC82_06780 [Oscillospiraceae bacterium]|jgi:hypothetical protein|nr:hypothetical protein [Oscillospiraceae bacterium]
MKKIIITFLSIIILIAISACSGTTSPQEQEREPVIYDPNEMPEPFTLTQNGGGNLHLMRFLSPTFNDLDDAKLDFIDLSFVEPFVELSKFYDWFNHLQASTLTNEPQTNLMGYPNMYSFVKTFDVPVDELRGIMEQFAELALTENIDHYTLEEIDIILSLNESMIMEYFVSDFSIYVDGMIFSPQWIYWNSIKDYEVVGITPEMVEERLELFSEFYFTPEAAEAFGKKLAEFIGAESSEVIKALNS